MSKKNSHPSALVTAFLIAQFLGSNAAALPQNGRLKGKVVDAQTGEALPGVNVIIDKTSIGAATDMNGVYNISPVLVGTYTLVTSMIGYAKLQVTNVKVTDREITELNFALQVEAIEAAEVVVEATALKNTEASLLKNRQKAAAVSDAISAEAISRTGSSNAADAMEQVTGVSVVDGKYVYVRGLGDRYMNTQLNGATLPSANPDRNAVTLDLFPAKLLENIVTVKTFTPDKPGNFTGGSVDIATRAFPEAFSVSFSTATSINTQTTLKGGYLTYPGGKTDWLGIDDGTRDLPTELADPSVKIPNIGEAFTNAEKAQELDRLSKAFSPVMSPTTKTAPVNQSYAFSVGNQISLFGHPLGFLGSLSYNRSLSSYKNGVTAQYNLTGKIAAVNELNILSSLADTKSADEVLWGGLINLSYKPHANHEVGFNYMYNRSGESVARYQSGLLPRDLVSGQTYETRVLQFTERDLRSVQLRGAHYLKGLLGMRLEWTSTWTNSSQDEPDLRFFTDHYQIVTRQGITDTLYTIAPSNYSRPVHYFRSLNEGLWESSFHLALPFKQWQGQKASLKIGGLYSEKDRVFRERRFEFYQSSTRYDGDSKNFFSAQNVGVLSSANGFYRFGNYVVDASQLANNYDGDQKISALFGMVDLPLLTRLRFIGGARFETTRNDVVSQDPAKPTSNLSNNDLLPSVNLIYQILSDMNLRAAYGRTLARPTFRELAPFASFDFVGDFIFVGNPELERTLVDNYDLRWEWFARSGEIYAVSGFYKRFQNPIERAIVSNNNQGQFQNVDEATVYGAEFEVRQRLDRISPTLQNFQVGGNLALVHSEVDIPAKELFVIRQLDPNASGKRELQGQSPYVLNIDLSYDKFETGTSVNLYYNIFGERLSEVSLGGTPNTYEQPRGALDFNFSQRLWGSMTIKASAKNLLDSSVRKAHHYKGVDYVSREYKRGRTFSFGVTYSVN